MNDYKWRNPTPDWIESYSFDDYVDTSLEKYKNIYSDEAIDLIKYFQDWKDGPTMTYTEFKKKPIIGARVELSQSDFNHGTVRLKLSAHYVLKENIIFEPNPNDDDWMPTEKQTSGGSKAEYPTFPFGGYHLGFFAAITIEGENIFLDLNSKILRQSKVFDLQQRFYANIELASTPFIPNQGPANFGDHVKSANNCLIANGVLGLSSHHGIHGNNMKNIIIQNLNIIEFEVAGIALNGGENCIIRNVNICNMASHIPVLSTYSAARFIRSFLKKIIKEHPSAGLDFAEGNKTGTEILTALETEMKEVLTAVRYNKSIRDNSIFKNKTGLYDGGGYGIVLNSKGVVVNGFANSREGAIGNERIIVHDVKINNLKTGQGEIIGLSKEGLCPKDICLGSAYGGKEQVGPVGSVFQIDVVSTEEGKYVGNVISNAKLFVAKFSEHSGTVNITKPIIEWALSGKSTLHTIMKDNEYYFLSGGDSMGHFMKGLIGFFISAGKNIISFNMEIKNIKNMGLPGKESGDVILPLMTVYNGAATRGLAVVGSEDIFLKNISIDNIISEHGNSCGLDLINECKNIRARDNIKINDIESASIINSGKSPNPPSQPLFIEISEKSKNIQIK
jgi:hypothetical protein